MSDPQRPAGALRLRLPATSANLGPGFDALAVALDFYLEIEAEPGAAFSISATGRDAQRCGQLEDNLIFEAYKRLLKANQRAVVPLAVRMVNGIPLGMGCGSSAAGRLAAIALANHFGGLGWTTGRILDEASALEGHPDNVGACWLGGFVAAACDGAHVVAAHIAPPAEWRALVVLPAEPLATSKARAVLPASYPLDDVVANLQSAALLAVAFAYGRADFLPIAMRDRIHQPYRAPFCPLLPLLLPLVGVHGILGAALSGAGPAVLMLIDAQENLPAASAAVTHALVASGQAEVLPTKFVTGGASQFIRVEPTPETDSAMLRR